MAATASNKRVILKRYVTGFLSEDDMEVVTTEAPPLPGSQFESAHGPLLDR